MRCARGDGVRAAHRPPANQAGDSLFFLNRFDEALAAIYRARQQHYAQALQARPGTVA